MLVAIIYEGKVEVNEYPLLEDIEVIRGDFIPGTILIELSEKPEVKEGYTLKYDGKDFYYEENIFLGDDTPYHPTNAEVAQMISDLQADLIIAGVL